MYFTVKKNGEFLDVSATGDNATIDLGLLDKDECSQLAIHLRGVADELDRCDERAKGVSRG